MPKKLELAVQYAKINANNGPKMAREYPLPSSVIPGAYWGFIAGYNQAELYLNQKQFDKMQQRIDALEKENEDLRLDLVMLNWVEP